MLTVSRTLSPVTTATVACSCCEAQIAENLIWPHYRGAANTPLCLPCATCDQVACSACGEFSPRGLMIEPRFADALVCPCTSPVWDGKLPDRSVAPHPALDEWELFFSEERTP